MKYIAETLAVEDSTPFHDVSLVRIFSFAEEISEGTSNCFLVTRCEVSTWRYLFILKPIRNRVQRKSIRWFVTNAFKIFVVLHTTKSAHAPWHGECWPLSDRLSFVMISCTKIVMYFRCYWRHFRHQNHPFRLALFLFATLRINIGETVAADVFRCGVHFISFRSVKELEMNLKFGSQSFIVRVPYLKSPEKPFVELRPAYSVKLVF